MDELFMRAAEDAAATERTMRAVREQLAGCEQHLEEIRLFKTMLQAYSGQPGAAAPQGGSVPTGALRADPFVPVTAGPADDSTDEDANNLPRDERIALKNRIFGLSA